MENQFFAQNETEIITSDITLKMSGLDFMMKIYKGELPLANIAKILNFKLSSVEIGSVCFEGSPTNDHYNISGDRKSVV